MSKINKIKGVEDEAHALESPSESGSPTRVTAIIVALENYRDARDGQKLASVDYAHADGEAFEKALRRIYADLPEDMLNVVLLKDTEASCAALRDELKYTIRNLDEDELFIFYYAGHGFHGSGGNRLSAYDTNQLNIADTTLQLQADLLEHLEDSQCRKALVFVDACAEKFAGVVKARDVISNLQASEVEEFLDSGWYCGVFLSCSPSEKSYPATPLKHGIWTHFLLEAIEGRAPEALRDRWLTDTSLRDYLRRRVPQYITRETNIKGSQTPQAILSSSNSFRIRYVQEVPSVSVPADAALAGIALKNQSEFLEGLETGKIRSQAGFTSKNRVPDKLSDSADQWCRRLLADQIGEEIQNIYQAVLSAFEARRRDVQKASDVGSGDIDTEFFRYSIISGQNPNDPAEYLIRRQLELRSGWEAKREAIAEVFDDQFEYLVIEFEKMKSSFDTLVDQLEDIQELHGGEVDDDDRSERVTYSRDGVEFTFDLCNQRLEIAFEETETLDILDAARQFQLGIHRASPMLAAPKR